MKQNSKLLTLFWVGFFAIWLLLLSGTLPYQENRPGVLQVFELKKHLQSQESSLTELDQRVHDTQKEIDEFNKNTVLQEQEIRRVLGYTAKNELVFYFR